MSGIGGIVDFSQAEVPAASFAVLRAASAYRGRDQIGVWHGVGASLVAFISHEVREAVGEHQPLVDPGSGVVVVADARVDDRDALAVALATRAGLAPTDGSKAGDATLIAAAHAAWGPEASGRIIGDFAYAAWDPASRVFYAARDPMGMRPCYYHWDGQRLVFASDIAAILAVLGVREALDERSVLAFLSGRESDPRWTPYRSIARLEAGHALQVDERGLRSRCFWRPDPAQRLRFRHEADYVDRFRDVFREAVRCRLRSTGSIGVTLSGGVDSSAVAAMAGVLVRDGLARGPITSYSWAFRDLPEVDERHLSDRLVAHCGLDGRYVWGDERWPLCDYPTRDPVLDDFTMIPYEPLVHQVIEQARSDGMRRLLVGTRGDAMVGEAVLDATGLLRNGRLRALTAELRSYSHYQGSRVATALQRLVMRPVVDVAIELTPWRAAYDRARVRRGLARVPAPPWLPQSHLERYRSELEAAAQPSVPEGFRGARAARYRVMFAGASMAAVSWSEQLHARGGLDTADPWSDRRVAEVVLATPPWLVQRIADPKHLAREAMRGVMPDGYRQAMRKTSPYPLYLRGVTDRARATIAGLLADPVAAALGYVEPGPLRAHYHALCDGAPEHPSFWRALAFELWVRRHRM